MKKAVILFFRLITISLLPAIVAAHEGHDHEKEKSFFISFVNGLPQNDGVYILEIQNLVKQGIIDKYNTWFVHA